MAASRVAAIMVNWNGGAMAVDAARSVAAQVPALRLIVVDNGSADGSADAIIAACPHVMLIRNRVNLGYAAANNQGFLAASDAESYLLVNNDIVLPDTESVAGAAGLIARGVARGVCGRYEYPDGRFQHFYNRLPGPLALAAYWGVLRHVPGILHCHEVRRYLALDLDPDRSASLEQPAFSCVLLDGDSVRAVGPLDERFPIYFNDVDYCRRWRGRGWSFHYDPEWRVVHHHGASGRKRPDVLTAELLASAARYARLAYPAPAGTLAAVCVVAEAFWRKWVSGERGLPAWGVARGSHFFSRPAPAAVEG